MVKAKSKLLKSVIINCITLTILLFITIKNTNAQNCFDAFDNLFTETNKSLPYEEFKKVEYSFINNLHGCKAIDFSVTSTDGEDLILEAMQGKVVVLNFWFTTCIPCLKEIPELNKLVTEYDADDVVFIGFARDDTTQLNAFFKRFGSFDFKIIPESYRIADSYRVIAWPESIVINKAGKIHKVWIGSSGGPQALVTDIRKSINKCLNE